VLLFLIVLGADRIINQATGRLLGQGTHSVTQPPGTALIVDDEKILQIVLARELALLGYESEAVSSGQEALERLASQRFDLVMLDARMPGISGLEVLKEVRAGHPDTCIVMLSAVVDTDVAAAALRLGADDYMTKPWDLEDLSLRLRRAREGRARAGQGKGERSSSRIAAPGVERAREITMDLISQQVTLFQRLAARSDSRGKARRSRGWWPWGRKS
jgi:DNA-binding response OmpR family regulator